LLRSSCDGFLDIVRETGLNAEARDTVESVDALRLKGFASDVSMDCSEGDPGVGDSTPTNVGELTSPRRARGTNVGVPTKRIFESQSSVFKIIIDPFLLGDAKISGASSTQLLASSSTCIGVARDSFNQGRVFPGVGGRRPSSSVGTSASSDAVGNADSNLISPSNEFFRA
jgi:hypothetical protein